MLKEKEVEVETKEAEKDAKREVINDNNVKKSDKYNKQTKIAVIVMLVLIASVLLANWIVQDSKKFEYNGLKFYKEKEGSISFYKSLLGYATASGENVPFILKLRNDPRELENIPIERSTEDIKLRIESVLSLSPEIANCSNTYITMLDFSMTLKAFGIKASGATTDKNYAKEHNTTFADCRDAKKKTVIVMKEGNETKITQDKDCWTIEIANCEIQESFERFILEFIANSMS